MNFHPNVLNIIADNQNLILLECCTTNHQQKTSCQKTTGTQTLTPNKSRPDDSFYELALTKKFCNGRQERRTTREPNGSALIGRWCASGRTARLWTTFAFTPPSKQPSSCTSCSPCHVVYSGMSTWHESLRLILIFHLPSHARYFPQARCNGDSSDWRVVLTWPLSIATHRPLISTITD